MAIVGKESRQNREVETLRADLPISLITKISERAWESGLQRNRYVEKLLIRALELEDIEENVKNEIGTLSSLTPDELSEVLRRRQKVS